MKQQTGVNQLRIAMVSAIFILLFCIALGHLFLTQIIRHEFYTKLATRQYHITITQQPDRGVFIDRKNAPLTFNQESYSLFITPSQMLNPKEAELFLQINFPNYLERFSTDKSISFTFIKRHLSQDEYEKVQNAQIPDLHLLKEHKRIYLAPSLVQTIGITDVDNKGLTGLELLYEQELSGIPTTYLLQKDARKNAFYFKKTILKQGTQGRDIKLTLDHNIQAVVFNKLKEHTSHWKAKEGMIIIMNPQNGDILANAIIPSCNPNDSATIQQEHLKNRTITESYELGSVMKTFSALAALEENVVSPEEIIDCRNTRETTIQGIRVTTWKYGGKLPFAQVIRESNNIGTALVALRLGKKLYDSLTRYGFGKKTALQLPGEATGIITPPHQWSKATPLSLSYGYEITASALQLATAFCMIANNGITVTPHLRADVPIKKEKIVETEIVKKLRDIITINKETSRYHKARFDGYTVQGKTGSAHLLTNGTYDKQRNIYTFGGILEQDSYQRVIVIIIKEPYKEAGKNLYAATVAAPLFKAVAEALVAIEKVPTRAKKEILYEHTNTTHRSRTV